MAAASNVQSDIDPFADEILADPYPAYRELRDLGPAVKLTTYDAWVLPRYQQVREALHDYETFTSVHGVGYDPELNKNTRGSVLTSEPPDHDRLRKIYTRQLSPRSLTSLEDYIRSQADELVASVTQRGDFDAMKELATVFPVNIVADLLGLSDEARPRLAEFANAVFNIFGPFNERTQESLPKVGQMFEYIGAALASDKVHEEGWVADTFQAVARGEMSQEEVMTHLGGYVTAGLDTTIHAIGNTLLMFASDPDLYEHVRVDPSLVTQAFEESLRLESPIQCFFRVARRDVDVEGTVIPEGARVMMSFGSANRDERKWERPDQFDIQRNPVDHLGFGHGIHACTGQGFARLEARSLLEAFVRRVSRVQLHGEPVRKLNNVIRGLESLPITVEVN